jgi:squalene cyclase
MANRDAAKSFVEIRGTLGERARLEHVLTGRVSSRQAVETVLSGQRADGGWPPLWAPDYSSLDATCFRLSQAEQMGLGDSNLRVARAIVFLSSRQNADGSWEEDSRFREAAPPWAKPGNQRAKIYISALCGFWLAVLKKKAEASAASQYLQGFIYQNGGLPTFPHGHWLAGGMWFRLGMKDLAEAVFKHIEESLGQLRPSNLGWLINTLYLAGVPVKHTLLDRSARLLDQCQREDGSWEAEDGPDFDVNATIEAVRALKVCNMLTLQ